MTKSVDKTVIKAALTEMKFPQNINTRTTVRGSSTKKAERNKQKNVPVEAYFTKVVRLSEEPIVIDLSNKILPQDCRTTNGWYSVTYNPEGSPKRVRGKPYTIGQDLVRGRFCVSGLKHLKALASRIPEFAFLLKWSYFDPGLFKLAKQHPGIAFCFNFKWCEYGSMIEKKAEEQGIDIDHKPFFAYITKKEKLDQLRKEYKIMPNPVKEDYIAVLDDLEKEADEHD